METSVISVRWPQTAYGTSNAALPLFRTQSSRPRSIAGASSWLSALGRSETRPRPKANINPMAVRQLMSLRGLRFEKAGTAEQHRRMGDIDRRLYGLALGFFRHRLAGGPFRWNESGDVGHSAASLEEVVRAVVN